MTASGIETDDGLTLDAETIIVSEMHIDPALLSSLSALIGALLGGGASLVAAIYTQRYQDRLRRAARETTKWEEVYADFIMNASKLLLSTYTPDELTLDDNPQHLIGLVNRMRLFAAPNVIDQAQAVIRGIVEISLKPSVNLRKLATAELSWNRDPDLLLPFSLACRADLDHVSRPVLLRLRKHKMNRIFCRAMVTRAP